MNSAVDDGESQLRNDARFARVAAAAAMLALVAQQAMLWWLYYHGGAKELVGDEGRYWNVAHDVLAGGAWHPSDIWPPAQPLFIALVVRLGADSVLAVQIVQTVLFFACAALVGDLWRRISGSARAGAIAALLFALAPSDAAYAQYLWPEVTHLVLVLAAFDLLLARRAGAAAAALAGACIGLALLFKSLLAAFWPLLLVCFVDGWRPLRVRATPALLFVAALAITAAPAIVAGHRVSGHWAIADSSMINLLIGLGVPDRNDYVDWPGSHRFEEYMASGSTPDERNAWARRQVEDLLREQGAGTLLVRQLGKQYFRLLESKTLLLTQLPGPRCAGYLSVYHDVPPWLAQVVRWSSHAFHALILAGFAFGVFLWRDWHNRAVWLLLAFVGYQLALYLGLLAIARYLLPMIPVFCGFAGVALAHASQGRAGATPLRLAGATLTALLLLFLAFAGPWIDGYCR